MSKFNPSYTGLREDIVSLIKGKDLNVLDIGCATGVTGKYLKDKGIASFVYGVEYLPEMGKEAAGFLNQVEIGDIQNNEVINRIPDNKFEYIILGDVLEHLYDPWIVLKKLSSKLLVGGRVIISLPNIGHIDVMIHLLFRKTWPLNERGIFDKSHLRYFAKNDVAKLIISSGLSVEMINRKFRFRDALGSRFPFYGAILRKAFPDLYTFQFLVVGIKK